MRQPADRPETFGIERGKLLALTVLAVVVAAASWALMSFNDRGVACGSALTSAVNGKPVLLNGAGGVLATGGQAKAFSFDEAHPFLRYPLHRGVPPTGPTPTRAFGDRHRPGNDRFDRWVANIQGTPRAASRRAVVRTCLIAPNGRSVRSTERIVG